MDRGSPYKIHWWRIVGCVAVLACAVAAVWLLRGRDERPMSEQGPVAQERDLQSPDALKRVPPAVTNVLSKDDSTGGTRFSASASPRGERLPKKMSRRLAELLATNPETVEVTVAPMSLGDLPALEAFVREQGGTVIADAPERARLLRARMSPSVVSKLMSRDDVRRLEPFARPRLLNDVATDIMGVPEVWNTHGLTGSGQLIMISDSGLDTGNPTTVMADFSGRVRAVSPTVSGCLTNDIVGHGTHTAGSLAGNGALSTGQFKGVAYESELWVWAFLKADGYGYYESYGRLFATGDSDVPSFIHSASWGNDRFLDEYSSDSVAIDDYLWHHPESLVVFSAGNSGSGSHTITEQASSKNVLAVGATESKRSGTFGIWTGGHPARMAGFSSRGPMNDGRIKPDICAPGVGILSTRSRELTKTDLGFGGYSNTNYTYMCGTSMATPLVAGAAALVRQWLVERRGYAFRPPTSALMKAIILGGAYDMSADAGADCGGAAPNGAQGWGRIDLEETLYPSNRSVRLVDRIPFAHDSTYTYRVATTNAAPLDVQLVWTDYPGPQTDDEDLALVNDLDLSVSNETTGVVLWGNDVTGGDRTNNVERVRILSAQPALYTIRVIGHKVPHDHTEGGAAALYLRGTFREGLMITLR